MLYSGKCAENEWLFCFGVILLTSAEIILTPLIRRWDSDLGRLLSQAWWELAIDQGEDISGSPPAGQPGFGLHALSKRREIVTRWAPRWPSIVSSPLLCQMHVTRRGQIKKLRVHSSPIHRVGVESYAA